MVSLHADPIDHRFTSTRTPESAPRRAVNPHRTRMRGEELTERQQEVLDHIWEHVQKCGVPPCCPELARTLKILTGPGLAYHRQPLEKLGWVQLNPGTDRGSRLYCAKAPRCSTSSSCATWPPERRSSPRRARHSSGCSTNCPGRTILRRTSRVLVRGAGMSCVGYATGAIIAIKRTRDASPGDVVMVRLGTEITLKCFHRLTQDQIELRPHAALTHTSSRTPDPTHLRQEPR